MVSARRLVPTLAIIALAGFAMASFEGPSPLAFRWAQPASAAPAGSPCVDANGAYVAVGGHVFGIDKSTGNTNWRFPPGEPIQGAFRVGAVLSDGVIVAAADDTTVYGLDAKTGTQLWSYLSPAAASTLPVVVGDNVVFGTANNQLIALKLKTGIPLWAKPIDVKNGLQSRMAVWQKYLIFGSGGTTLNALDITSQKIVYAAPFASLSTGSFSVYGDRIYVNSSTYVVAVRAQSGSAAWSTNIGESLSDAPGVSADGVAVVTTRGMLYALDSRGQARFKKGVNLDASAIGSPVFSGSKIIVTNENGTVNMVDSKTADLVWSVTIPPLFTGMKATKPKTNTGNGTGGGGVGGGPGGIGGGPGGPGGPGGTSADGEVLKYIQASGTPVVNGNSLFVLGRDGSLLVYDKNLGVDLTPPEVKLLWPNPGDQVAGKAPMDIIFRIQDWGVGVNPDTLSVTIGNKPYFGTLTRDGYLRIEINSATKNTPLADGRQKIVVTVSDWLANKAVVEFSLSIDNTLPALGSPKAAKPGNGGPGGFGGGGSGNGGGNDGG